MEEYAKIVQDLIKMMDNHPDWKVLLETSIKEAYARGGTEVNSLHAYYSWLDKQVHWIPVERDIMPKLCEFYWLIDQPPGQKLQGEEEFNKWMVGFADAWGAFLDTPESAGGIQTFMDVLEFHMDDFYKPASGWQTFNQFFARHIKPGKRNPDSPDDEGVIVSPADSVYHGAWEITEDAKIVVKGIKYSIGQLLEGSPFANKFDGGTFIHSFLNVNDYHRYHTPVAGHVRECRDIPGKVFLDVYLGKDGKLHAKDGTGYQFTQARGLLVLENEVLGFVAVLPIGMAQVSSCNLDVDVDDFLPKGSEFGFFTFGGSDIIVLFQRGMVEIDAQPGTHYNVGKWIGTAK